MVIIPFSSLHDLMASFTTIIFKNESVNFRREAISCLRFYSSGNAKADSM